jgi:four helix bundle protein
VAEGWARVGADRAHLLRIALGSLREVRTCLVIALRLGWFDEPVTAELRDRLGALLYCATRKVRRPAYSGRPAMMASDTD